MYFTDIKKEGLCGPLLIGTNVVSGSKIVVATGIPQKLSSKTVCAW
jgi:hypothetical protein